MIKEIVTPSTGLEILTKKSEPITDVEKQGLKELLQDLVDTAQHCASIGKGCAGLAANQIGTNLQVFVMAFGNKFICVVNPVVLKQCPKTSLGREGCLSLPGQNPVAISRPKWIKVQYISPEQGKLVTKKFHGFDARVFCHELDHLKGVLI